MGITSLDEAVGGNTVLGLWDLDTMEAVTRPRDARHMRGRLWYDDAIPKLLSGMPEDLEQEPGKKAEYNGVEGEASWSAEVPVEVTPVPHPYQDSVTELAEGTKGKREAWESRLLKGIAKVNSMIQNPALKLLD